MPFVPTVSNTVRRLELTDFRETAMRRYSLLPLSLISAAALFASPVFAQEARIYCCDDANGRKVCGDFVPKECERRAYEERDNKGYVINKGTARR